MKKLTTTVVLTVQQVPVLMLQSRQERRRLPPFRLENPPLTVAQTRILQAQTMRQPLMLLNPCLALGLRRLSRLKVKKIRMRLRRKQRPPSASVRRHRHRHLHLQLRWRRARRAPVWKVQSLRLPRPASLLAALPRLPRIRQRQRMQMRGKLRQASGSVPLARDRRCLPPSRLGLLLQTRLIVPHQPRLPM